MKKMLFFVICLFACLSVVKADEDIYQKMKTSLEDGPYINCKDSDGCIPLCVYYPYISGGYDNIGMVGFKYNATDESMSKWQIGFTYSRKHYLYTESKYLPSSRVYKGGYNSSPSEGWRDTDLYSYLSKDFTCPKYMTVSASGNEASCFSNEATSCKETRSDLTATLELNYNFVEEYTPIINDVYNQMKFYVNNNAGYVGSKPEFHKDSNNNDKIKFLHDYDVDESGNSNISFDSSKSPEENAKANCEYIKRFSTNSSGIVEAYVKTKLVNEKNVKQYFNDELDVALQNRAKQSNVRYLKAYTHDNLEKLMISGKKDGEYIYRKIAMNNNVSAFENVNNLFAYNATIAVEYISKTCDINLGNTTLNERLTEASRLYHANIYSDPTINFDDKSGYDCSFLSDIADVISTGYFILEMVGLAILVIFTAFDYVKIFLNDNADELKKANGHFLKRLIIAVILFLLPAIINLILSALKIENFNSDAPLCIEISNK